MILWDLLRLQTDTQDNLEYVIFMDGEKEIHQINTIPYACLIKKIAMWEMDTRPVGIVCMKIWLG